MKHKNEINETRISNYQQSEPAAGPVPCYGVGEASWGGGTDELEENRIFIDAQHIIYKLITSNK